MKNETKSNEELKNEVLSFNFNGTKYEWAKEYITGADLRKIGNIPHDEEIFLKTKGPLDDELISDDQEVNLAQPGIEHFYSKPKAHVVTLIVNGRERQWEGRSITFEQLVILAFGSYDPNPSIVYTVTYDRGPKENPEGTMVRGDSVIVKNKMIFNVTRTDKS